MPDSISDYLRQDMACEGLLECFHGLTSLDREVFSVLAENDDALTIDEIAEAVDRERSTAYRSVQRLKQAGLVRRDQVNYEQGGYYHVFSPVPAEEIADNFQRLLNDWYAQMGQLIDEFESKYAGIRSAAEP
jgi:predicted transcriptional regulator